MRIPVFHNWKVCLVNFLQYHFNCRAIIPGRLAGVLVSLVFMAIMGAQLPGQESLEDKYQQATAEVALLTRMLAEKERLRKSGTEDRIVEEDRKKLIQAQDDQKRYLDKLISLNPENEEYRFELARLFSTRGEADLSV